MLRNITIITWILKKTTTVLIFWQPSKLVWRFNC